MLKETASNWLSCLDLNIPFSFKKTCLFLLFFILLIVFFLGVPLLCTVMILKPKMPDFSLQTVNMESYKLELSSQSLVVSSVFSLNLRAENPSKVGLSFDPSRFHVLSQGLVVGLIRIPQFHQPPLSKNVSVQSRASFECVNISEIMYGNSRKDDSSKGVFGIRILGDVKAQLQIFRITLPKVKVVLDCEINASQSEFAVSSMEVYGMRWNHNNLISLLLDSQTVSRKCSLAISV